MTPAQQRFLMWLQKRDPALVQLAEKRYRAKFRRRPTAFGLSGMGEDQSKPQFWQTLVETASSVLPTLVSMPLQKKILDVQIKRAEAGLPPLAAEQYVAPIKISADVSPETEAALTRVAQESTKTGIAEITSKIAPFAIPAALAWVLLGRKKK